MLDLYHCKDARSFRCLWLLEEMGATYNLIKLDYPPKETSPKYLEINPAGTVPCLVDGETTLFESGAILEYLTATDAGAAFAVRPGHPEYGNWLNWVHFGEASLTVPLAALFRFAHRLPPEQRQPGAAADCRAQFIEKLAVLERTLAHREYLADGRFTSADISVAYALMLARALGLEGEFPPAVSAWLERVCARPAFAAARAAQKAAPLATL
ncbi:glutathione S-transferase family protein [Paraburkholderia bannensis]|uniref:glutathione S-transferase family protein n=1 Tax=Paraburkholderia bannensis TaxID=765414 RepID=UPI002AC34849|nr:glutathione S-transferase family protein [Paraburkholderia bannensis]